MVDGKLEGVFLYFFKMKFLTDHLHIEVPPEGQGQSVCTKEVSVRLVYI